ncbi:hypothetical protein BC835DRAFT_1303295 [Cytidiella melzeri]|nr:hypothetical protein BC835DRAFT_1306845 [Cytidiella melzeri]KAI0703061.1 hypothetical protein BC835DRAFT_1303295 [Cytidiella melzeri]
MSGLFAQVTATPVRYVFSCYLDDRCCFVNSTQVFRYGHTCARRRGWQKFEEAVLPWEFERSTASSRRSVGDQYRDTSGLTGAAGHEEIASSVVAPAEVASISEVVFKVREWIREMGKRWEWVTLSQIHLVLQNPYLKLEACPSLYRKHWYR